MYFAKDTQDLGPIRDCAMQAKRGHLKLGHCKAKLSQNSHALFNVNIGG